MNYKAIAEHISKRCRRALGAVESDEQLGSDGGFIVHRPFKSSIGYDDDRISTYSFIVGEMGPDVRKFIWRAVVNVTQDGDVFLDRKYGPIPAFIEDCFTSGRWE